MKSGLSHLMQIVETGRQRRTRGWWEGTGLSSREKITLDLVHRGKWQGYPRYFRKHRFNEMCPTIISFIHSSIHSLSMQAQSSCEWVRERCSIFNSLVWLWMKSVVPRREGTLSELTGGCQGVTWKPGCTESKQGVTLLLKVEASPSRW